MVDRIPQNIEEYLEQRLGALAGACRLALALDPERRLKPDVHAGLTDACGKQWHVVRFRNDDLALRRRLRTDDPLLIWAQPPFTPPDALIDLSYLPDLVARLAAEQVVDLSLSGVLQTLVPEETFPPLAVAEYAAFFADRLPDLVREHRELRGHSRFRPPLAREHVQALALCCRHPELQAGHLLFNETDLPSALLHYLSLLIETPWAGDEISLLRELAQQSPLEENARKRLDVWLQPEPEDLLRAVYLRWIAHVTGLSENVAGQVYSTGLCACDPREWEREWDPVRRWLQRHEPERTQLTVRVEERLQLEELERLDALLPKRLNDTGREQLQQFPPAALWRLVVKTSVDLAGNTPLNPPFARGEAGDTPLGPPFARGEADTPFGPPFAKGEANFLPATPFTDLARDGLQLLELCGRTPWHAELPQGDLRLNEWLDAYLRGGVYTLELRLAQARRLIGRLPDEDLQERMARTLDALSQQVRRQLHEWDTRLVAALQADWDGYRQGAWGSVRALGDLLPGRGRIAPPIPPGSGGERGGVGSGGERGGERGGAAVWLLVFDGMRLDTWEMTVQPLLREAFVVEQTATYLCALPSETHTARRSLLAGAWPESWRDWNGQPTDKEETLLAVNLGLDRETARRSLLTVVPAEGIALAKLRRPFNLIIYKLSDQWIHQFGQDLAALNEEIERRLIRDLLPALRAAVKPQDTVLVLSDHGFAELHPDDQVEVAVGDASEAEPSDIQFRVAAGRRLDGAFLLTTPDGREDSLAVGPAWFRRPGGRWKRYAHGGVSFAEMVVPAARLRVKQAEACRLELSAPDQLTLGEDTVESVTLTLRNTGTIPVNYTITVGCNLLDLPVKPDLLPPDRLDAGEGRAIALQVTAKNGLSVLRVQVAYSGGEHHPPPLRRNIPVKVEARTDQIKLVGLEL